MSTEVLGIACSVLKMIELVKSVESSVDMVCRRATICESNRTIIRENDLERYFNKNISGNTIRLLKIAPGREPDPISAEISTMDLERSHSYEALSYHWGNPADNRNIYVQSIEASVAANMYETLLKTGVAKKPRMVWLDALCINQSDMTERDPQLYLMEKWHRQSFSVLVWLKQGNERARPDTLLGTRSADQWLNFAYSFHLRTMQKSFQGNNELPWEKSFGIMDWWPCWKCCYCISDSVRLKETWSQQRRLRGYEPPEISTGLHGGWHIDIKPENILWFPNAVAFENRHQRHLEISDFGLGSIQRMSDKYWSFDEVMLENRIVEFGRHGDVKSDPIPWLPHLHAADFGDGRIRQGTREASNSGRGIMDSRSKFLNWISFGTIPFKEGQQGALESAHRSIRRWIVSQYFRFQSLPRCPQGGRRRHRRSMNLMMPFLLAFATPGATQPLDSDTIRMSESDSMRSHTASTFLRSLLGPWTDPGRHLSSPGILIIDLFLCTFITVLVITCRRHEKWQKYFLAAGTLISITVGAFCAHGLQNFVFWWIFGGINASLGLSVLYHAWHSPSGMKTKRYDMVESLDRETMKFVSKIYGADLKRGI